MNILITAQFDEASREILARHGQVIYEGFGDKMRLLAGRKLSNRLRETRADIFVTEVDQLRAPVIAQAEHLQVVACCRGDPVNIDVGACTARGIPVLHAPGRNADAVAELTVAFMLMLGRNILPAIKLLQEGDGGIATMAQAFFDLKGRELWNRTVGLVGLGAVGREVAARLRVFGARVVAYDPYVAPEFASELGVTRVSLEQLLGESDIISLHAAVTPETTGLIGAEQLAWIKPDAYFINTARAALVDENALVQALREKRIAGAAIDVFAQDPPEPDNPLLHLENVLATPHIGGNTRQVVIHHSQIITLDLVALLEGRTPQHVANPEALQSFRWRSV